MNRPSHRTVGRGIPALRTRAMYLVDISKTDVYNSYFELALDDWSEPLGDLIVGRRFFAASGGGTQYAILASW